MNDIPPTIDEDDLEREELVAYLDDELEADAADRVEQRLSTDPNYRQRLAQLQRAWDMLDSLPKAEVPESFTQSTVEMVVSQLTNDIEKQEGATGRKRFAWWGIGTAALTATVLAGYFAVTAKTAAENRQMVDDLPIIQNVDMFLATTDIEFLKELDKQALFVNSEEFPEANLDSDQEGTDAQ